MGYTHYWRGEDDLDEKEYANSLKDIAKIVISKKNILANDNGDKESKPEVTDGISFNGIGDDGYLFRYFLANESSLKSIYEQTA